MEKDINLPVGQPDGVKAFAADGHSKSYWRHFEGDEVFNGPGGWGSAINTLITVEKIDGKTHVCFMQDPLDRGIGVINGVKGLATAIFREARNAALIDKKQLGLKQNFIEMVTGASAKRIPSPSDFQFYVHVPAKEDREQRELFARIDMEYGDGAFHSPQSNYMGVIPAAIQSAPDHEMREPAAKPVAAQPRATIDA